MDIIDGRGGSGYADYRQDAKVAFTLRILYVMAAVTALGIFLYAVIENKYGSLPDASKANCLELSKYVAMGAGSVAGIAILRDLYAGLRAGHAEGAKEGVRIALTEMAVTTGALFVGIYVTGKGIMNK